MKQMGFDPTQPAAYTADTNDEPGIADGFGEGLTEKDVVADGKRDRWAWMDQAESAAGSGTGSGASAGAKRPREEGAPRAEAKRAKTADAGFHGASNSSLATDGEITGVKPLLTSKPSLGKYTAVLLDIEGCTTPLSFVHETLFPYASKHLPAWITANWETKECVSMISDMQTLLQKDILSAHDAILELQSLADSNAKVGPLKLVQGAVWRAGYATGELQGDIYSDVRPFLVRARDDGVKSYIYSSGSREAQRLLFGYSIEGDMRPFLSGYFDTSSGAKTDDASYKNICLSIGVDKPSDVLFFTDSAKEAVAATRAGCHVVLTCRPGNVELPRN